MMSKSRQSNREGLFAPTGAGPHPGMRVCDTPGCEEPGLYRAPKSRTALTDYYWFCLEHVKAYNKSWNYYADLTEAEIEELNRADTIWRRPTWPLGSRDGRRMGSYRIGDRLGLFEGGARPGDSRAEGVPRRGTPEEKAMAVLDLEPPITLEQLKARYKVLVKRLHPDANGGDEAAEERLKVINEAYTTLKNWVPA